MTRRRPSAAACAAFLACACVAIGSGEARGQATEKPSPRDGTVTAVKGQTMTIELASDAKTQTSVVEFLIRDFPLSGDLGALVSKGEDRTKVSVSYTPLQDTAATSDSFTYSVRYPGGLWSPQAKVTIKLEASEPKIGATPEVEFGRVMIGQSETREISLSNSGTAGYRNQIRLEAPFSLVEPANGLLDVPVGGRQMVKVRFAPIAEGPVNFQFGFFRNAGATTSLKGAGYAPFALDAGEVTLRWDEKSRTRVGTVSVRGVAPKFIAATVTPGDERLRASTTASALILKPDETSILPLYLEARDTQPYSGTLEIAVGDFRVPLKVNAAVAPAYLMVETGPASAERSIDLGPIKPGGVAQGSFQLTNAGGSPCRVTFSTDAPFAILAAGGRATLTPLEAESFAVRITGPPDASGPQAGNLKIEADNGQIVNIALKSVILPDGSPPPVVLAPSNAPVFAAASTSNAVATTTTPGAPPAPGKRLTTEEEQKAIAEMERLRSPLGFIAMPTVERKIDPNVPPVTGDTLKLLADGTHNLQVEWRQPAGSRGDYEIEMLRVRQPGENAALEGVWVPYHDVQYLPDSEGGMSADIRGLSPNRTYEFRLFTLGESGKVSAPLPFVAKTTMPLDWTWIYVSVGFLLLAGAGYGVWRVWGPELRLVAMSIPGLKGR